MQTKLVPKKDSFDCQQNNSKNIQFILPILLLTNFDNIFFSRITKTNKDRRKANIVFKLINIKNTKSYT
jgi:hypothetical protein